MRIISGTHKARRFNPPASLKARPTTDFAKEGLFNVLDNLISFDDISVLDLFSGTGSISYECASRGAGSIYSIELDFQNSRYIKKTSEELGLNAIRVIKGDAFKFVSACGMKFDFIFADPPYALETLATIPDKVFAAGVLAADGLFVLEHGRTNSFTEHPNFVEERSYGNVHFSLFRNKSM
ncbi:MAG: RsmD family RNA methyltransferase [Bacteroidales bacterium]|nr:RsmD family RNA methyltransferase [Bacteroidales bacterium]MDY6427445.1 RsmD family RNA methyltransferase [Bacteroidales bacterium]